MSILMQKLFKSLRQEADEGGEGSGGGSEAGNGDENLQREQEVEASRKGWVPKHKFKGPEGQWKDAATFLRDGESFKGAMQGEISRLKRELEEFKGTAKQFAEFQQRQIEQRDSEISNLTRDLKRQQREAIRNGDDEAADAIEDRIAILDEERRTTKSQLKDTKPNEQATTPTADPMSVDEHGNTQNPVILAWVADGNQWFQQDKKMRDYAFGIANELIQGGETRRGRPFLDAIAEKMAEAFPLKFGEGRSDPTRRGSMTESGRSSSGSGNYTKNDLPEEDRRLMELGIRQGWTTEANFVKNYFAESQGPRTHRTPAKK